MPRLRESNGVVSLRGRSRPLARHRFSRGFIFLHEDKGCIRPNARAVLYCLKRAIKLTITKGKLAVSDTSKLSRSSRESEQMICREKRYHRNFARGSVRVGLEAGRSFVVCFVLVICSAMDISFIG